MSLHQPGSSSPVSLTTITYIKEFHPPWLASSSKGQPRLLQERPWQMWKPRAYHLATGPVWSGYLCHTLPIPCQLPVLSVQCVLSLVLPVPSCMMKSGFAVKLGVLSVLGKHTWLSFNEALLACELIRSQFSKCPTLVSNFSTTWNTLSQEHRPWGQPLGW